MRVFTELPPADWRSVGPAAQAAEAAGFDALMTTELGHDVLAPLAFAAVATERVELTPSIAVAFPRSPTVLASQAWDLQANSRGRFVLGLGPQVKGHNERRFGIAWSPPAPRLREYIEALRAIWRCWETGEKLDYHGKHYALTLMTPDFSPERTGLPMVPVAISAVGPAMLRLAGELCDGVRLHPICSRRYLEEVCLPAMLEGMVRTGRRREHFDIHGGGFVCTGLDEAAVRKAMDAARFRVAFYGSTRTYMPILKLHGLEDLGHKLHGMSVQGRWKEMASQISDDTLRLFAACGTYAEIPREIERRFGGAADSITIPMPAGWQSESEPVREMLAAIHRIPPAFGGFRTEG
ncbi:MAG TPA: TIGR03617 family F420-dependent LLM class oxidoreductase [Reyranella sp.]|nr:TIGR03617 family F420-dependent LLM class oxidoreductase [Reyranella sp.]